MTRTYLPTAPDTAARVVDALNAGAAAGRRYELVRPEEARYTRDFAFAQAAGGGEQHSVLVDAADGVAGAIADHLQVKDLVLALPKRRRDE